MAGIKFGAFKLKQCDTIICIPFNGCVMIATILMKFFLCFRDVAAPNCVKDIIVSLQRKHGLKIPQRNEEWGDITRTSICIRRSLVLKDGLKEASKARFDPYNLLKVN